MTHVIEAAADAAFDRYTSALAQQAKPLATRDLFGNPHVAEWRGIWIACERAAVLS